MSDTPTYQVWCRLFAAGDWAGSPAVDQRWHSFEAFLADMGELRDGFTIQRLDQGKDFSVENCLWIPVEEARRRRRKGKEATLARQYKLHVGRGVRAGFGHLTREEWEALVLQPCFYCGDVETRISENSKRVGRTEDSVQMVGVDRRDNSKGYTVENCVACCATCNRFKWNRNADDFLAWAARIHAHQVSRGEV
jgi:hypothetical protein